MLLQLKQLAKKRPGSTDSYLFRNLSAAVAEPQIIHLLGFSGQGKSTLLRIIARLSGADAGELYLFDQPMAAYSPEEWRSTVCYVAQQPIMLPGSVEDNLRIASHLQQIPFDRDYARQLMERMELHLDWSKAAAQLSGGEKQRLALIRALLLRPRILLLDEVTSALDIHSQHAVEQVLLELQRSEGTAQIWVTHQLEQARRISQRIWFLAEEQLLEDSSPQAFFHSPRTEEARRFLQTSLEKVTN
ncbi:ABC transporter ATP-binding protein [Brevibacillus fulvus]|nr:ATP-binding cassette domain-containing protein [Brevibacillus fulvus]